MAFTTHCDNLNCRKENQPVIDKDTNKVYCSICNQEINSLTSFAKNTLKSLGQVKKPIKQPFGMHCKKCNNQYTPKKIGDDKYACGFCNEPLELQHTFKIMLKQYLK